MTYIAKLPNELLLDIFGYVSSPDLVNAMLSCSAWHRLAATVLYADIVLDSRLHDNSPTSRFAQQFHQFHLVQSFTLRFTEVHLMGFNITSVEAYKRLWELCDVLPDLTNLKTFSLFLEDAVGQGFPAPSTAIVPVINSLPQTVVNLNLDCDRLEDPNLAQPHVCHAVSVLVPRLKTLRLRLSHLCSGLFSSLSSHAYIEHDRHGHATTSRRPKATSALEYASIRLDTQPDLPHGTNSCLCYSGGKALQGVRLARTLENLHELGAFPSLRRFAIVTHIDAVHSPRNEHWDVFKVRDLTRDTIRATTSLECARDGSSSLFMIRDMGGTGSGPFTMFQDHWKGYPLAGDKFEGFSLTSVGTE